MDFIWGSFERNLGTWCPYTKEECRQIEDSYRSSQQSVHLPSCFGATLHFSRDDDLHYQITPQIGAKREGFRSVHRATFGEQIFLYWNDHFQRWEKQSGNFSHFSKTVTIDKQPIEDEFIWQWCDLENDKYMCALEGNWHPFSQETNEIIDSAYSAKSHATIEIGLSKYNVGDWNGVYGVQTNLESGVRRKIRKGRMKIVQPPPSEYADESCAFCTDSFADTPAWPTRTTPCGHRFHYSCLQAFLRRGSTRCPMCRGSIASMLPPTR